MKTALSSVLTLAMLTAVAPAALAAAPAKAPLTQAMRHFVVSEDHHSPNEASFTSRAAIVKFQGRTAKLSGDAAIDLAHTQRSHGTIVVDLASLDTGVALRNEHMRGFLETAKYPSATYKFTSIKFPGNKLKPNSLETGTAIGTMTIHGVTRPLNATVLVSYLPEQDAKYRAGDWVHLESNFKIKLSDYGIQMPQGVLGVKVSNDLDLAVEGMAKAE